MIKAVSFDIGGTLIEFAKGCSLKKTLLQALNVDSNVLNKAYKEYFTERKISLHDFCERIQYENPSRIEEIVTKYYDEKPLGTLHHNVVYVLSELKRKGYFLMAVSNKSYQNPSCLEVYCLSEYFDAEIYSYQVGSAKPNMRIFQYAQHIANVRSDEIVHVGNSLKSDVFGAKSLNWRTVLIQGEREFQSQTMELDMRPDYVITNLEQLLTVINRMNEVFGI